MEYRGIIAGAVIQPSGRCHGTLVSADRFEGEPGRYPLVKGEFIDTSPVVSVDLDGVDLAIKTMNSLYLIEGDLQFSFTQDYKGKTSAEAQAEYRELLTLTQSQVDHYEGLGEKGGLDDDF